MLYKQTRFSVPAVGNSPVACTHGWVAKGKCIFCGEQLVVIKSDVPVVDKNPLDDATGTPS